MIEAAIEELKTHQTQLDMDGVMVGVSRQALEELLAHVAAQPAPIAGLEPVAWRWRHDAGLWQFAGVEPTGPSAHLFDVQPLYTRSQLEAHAAEQVRPLVEALEGLIEAVRRDSDEGGKGISGYTGARLTDAKNAIRARGQV